MSGDWASRPHIRARDIDREYAMGLLRHASAEGQLSYEEFEQRLAIAMRAQTLGELATLVDDLQARPEPPAPVPVVAAVPYPYIYAPARPERNRSWTRGIAALVAGVMALVVVGSLASANDTDSGAPAAQPAAVEPPDPCFGVAADEVDLARCVSADNPLLEADLSARAAERQKDLDLPGNLPVPERATFVRPGWVSATYNEDGRQQLTRRWHLEYLVASEPGEPVTAAHVAEVYRSTVAPVSFGTLGEEGPLGDGGVKLRWTGGTYPLTVSVEPDQRDGMWRVRLDVSVDTSTSIMRPDVSGEFRQQLKVQRIATVPGMMYESSKVTWIGATSCRLEQVWSATPDQLDQIGKQAKDLDATIEAKSEGGTRLVFQSVLRDCTTFQL